MHLLRFIFFNFDLVLLLLLLLLSFIGVESQFGVKTFSSVSF